MDACVSNHVGAWKKPPPSFKLISVKRGQKRKRKLKQLRQQEKVPNTPIADKKETNGTNRKWLLLKSVLGAFVSVMGVAAAIITLYQMAPHLHLRPGVVLNPQQPFSTQFEISNDGYLAATQVSLLCAINQLTLQRGMGRVAMNNIGLASYSENISLLRDNETATFPLEKFLGQSGAGSADVTFVISYKIRILPFLGKFQYKQRFYSVNNVNGEAQWDAAPAN